MMQNKVPEDYISETKNSGSGFYKIEIPSKYILKYYVKKDDKIFILMPENENFPEIKPVFDQMLQSFKFTE